MNPKITIGKVRSSSADGPASDQSGSISLPGEKPVVPGIPGKSAYEIAVEEGFKGNKLQWLESLKGKAGSDAHVDLSGYAKKTELPSIILDTASRKLTVNGQDISIPQNVDLSGYAKKAELPSIAYDKDTRTLTVNGTEVVIPESVDLSPYYTKAEVDARIKNGTQIDLSPYVKSQELSTYAKKIDIPSLEPYETKDNASRTYATKRELSTVKLTPGPNGKSAYDIWKSLGNDGTETDFINSLKGKDGVQGPQGVPGENGVPGKNGERGPKGDPGIPGHDGPQGKRGFSIWANKYSRGSVNGSWWSDLYGASSSNGPQIGDLVVEPDGAYYQVTGVTTGGSDNGGGTFNLGAKLGSLMGSRGPQGPKGDPGIQGQQGKEGVKGEPGENGKSAYEIWKENGHQGSEQDFVNSLKGAKGDRGEKGEPGAKGDPGEIPDVSDIKKNINETKQDIVRMNTKLNSMFVNILDFGAQPENVNFDSAPAFNRAVQALPSVGGTIFIPNGNYFLKSTVNIDRSYVHVIGLNNGLRSGIDPADGSTQTGGGGAKVTVQNPITAFKLENTHNNNRLSGITFSGFDLRGDTNGGVGIDGVTNADRVVIDNMTINNVGIGVRLHAADAPRITNSWIAETQSSILLTGASQQAEIKNNSLGAQPNGTTIYMENPDRYNISGNNIYPDGASAIRIMNPVHGSIVGNTMSAYYNGMIEFLPNSDGAFGNGNVISSNVIAVESWHNNPDGKDNKWGIIHIEAFNNVISGNNILANGTPKDTTGILIMKGDYNRIANNVITIPDTNAKVVINGAANNNWVIYSTEGSAFQDGGNQSNKNIGI